jgi:hypothetical protein
VTGGIQAGELWAVVAPTIPHVVPSTVTTEILGEELAKVHRLCHCAIVTAALTGCVATSCGRAYPPFTQFTKPPESAERCALCVLASDCECPRCGCLSDRIWVVPQEDA